MTTQLKTTSNIKDESGKIVAKREVHTGIPDCLAAETLEEKVEMLGEDLINQKIDAQLTVDFRAMVRRMLESTDDNEDFKYSEEFVANKDFSDWKPQLRQTKSAEEKALEALGALPADVRAAVLANFEKGGDSN